MSFGVEPAAGRGSLCGGPAAGAAAGFGSPPLWSPSGNAKHLDVKGDQTPDLKVGCGFLASSPKVLLLQTSCGFDPRLY